MSESEVEEKKVVDVRLFDIPEEDWFAFKEIMKSFGYNKATAFRACLDAYYISRLLGDISVRLDGIEERISRLEVDERKEIAKGTKTFGGGFIGGKDNGIN